VVVVANLHFACFTTLHTCKYVLACFLLYFSLLCFTLGASCPYKVTIVSHHVPLLMLFASGRCLVRAYPADLHSWDGVPDLRFGWTKQFGYRDIVTVEEVVL
jgi:hypothetical protein